MFKDGSVKRDNDAEETTGTSAVRAPGLVLVALVHVSSSFQVFSALPYLLTMFQ